MKIEFPEIYWHGYKERIMSIDFYPFSNFFVTGGSDSEFNMGFIKVNIFELIKILFFKKKQWEFQENGEKSEKVVFLGNLENGHNATVNSVKFSPNGQYLASASDGIIILINN